MKRLYVAVVVFTTVFVGSSSHQSVHANAMTRSGQGSTGTRLVTGDNHSCVLLADGVVKCWGDNTYGQLGVEEITESLIPVTVSPFGSDRYATEIAAGKNHTCALLNDGSVSCWGHNSFGSLGSGDGGHSTAPINIVGLRLVEIDAGGFSTCGTDESGKLQCWGANVYGQLGIGSATQYFSTPQIVLYQGNVTRLLAVDMGETHACATSQLNETWCWGRNNYGQLGTGDVTSTKVPVKSVLWTNGRSTSSVVSGGLHSCALANNNSLNCWGRNSQGQLGDGSVIENTTPRPVTNLNAVDITAGTSHTCGTLVDGSMVCWGSNGDGQLGTTATTDTKSNIPVAVALPAGTKIKEMSAGGNHTCALTFTEEVLCWGNNDSGQLGNNSIDSHSTPVKVLQLHSAAHSGGSVSSSITDNSALLTTTFAHTDSVTHRSLSYGTDEQMSSVKETIDLGHFGPIRTVTVGSHHSCLVLIDGHAKCWGVNTHGAVGDGSLTMREHPVDVQGLPHAVRETAVGTGHSCAVLANGELWCWGDNSSGQLGDESVTSTKQPVRSKIQNVVDVVAGDDFTCALQIAGVLKCWGSNAHQQLARTGTSTSTPETISIDGSYTIEAVSASSHNACALLSNGTVKCWGNGVSTPTSPGAFSETVANISVGDNHACATLHSGVVQCWGNDNFGQLGNAASTNSGDLVTVEMPVGSFVLSAITAENATCALLTTGEVLCWGDNQYGVVAPQSSDATVTVPAQLIGLDAIDVAHMSIGQLHGCVVSHNGSLWCWGSNDRQQRGVTGNHVVGPSEVASHSNAAIATEIFGLEEDTTYYFQLATQQHGVRSHTSISWFNTLQTPVVRPPDDPVLDPPNDEEPVIDVPTPPVNVPSVSDEATLQVPNDSRAVQQVPNETPSDSGKGRSVATSPPSVKVGSWTKTSKVLRTLKYPVPKATSGKRVWLTVLNKRICRIYNGQLWAIRSGTCRLMVLSMAANRKLTMKPMNLKITGDASRK